MRTVVLVALVALSVLLCTSGGAEARPWTQKDVLIRGQRMFQALEEMVEQYNEEGGLGFQDLDTPVLALERAVAQLNHDGIVARWKEFRHDNDLEDADYDVDIVQQANDDIVLIEEPLKTMVLAWKGQVEENRKLEEHVQKECVAPLRRALTKQRDALGIKRKMMKGALNNEPDEADAVADFKKLVVQPAEGAVAVFMECAKERVQGYLEQYAAKLFRVEAAKKDFDVARTKFAAVMEKTEEEKLAKPTPTPTPHGEDPVEVAARVQAARDANRAEGEAAGEAFDAAQDAAEAEALAEEDAAAAEDKGYGNDADDAAADAAEEADEAAEAQGAEKPQAAAGAGGAAGAAGGAAAGNAKADAETLPTQTTPGGGAKAEAGEVAPVRVEPDTPVEEAVDEFDAIERRMPAQEIEGAPLPADAKAAMKAAELGDKAEQAEEREEAAEAMGMPAPMTEQPRLALGGIDSMAGGMQMPTFLQVGAAPKAKEDEDAEDDDEEEEDTDDEDAEEVEDDSDAQSDGNSAKHVGGAGADAGVGRGDWREFWLGEFDRVKSTLSAVAVQLAALEEEMKTPPLARYQRIGTLVHHLAQQGTDAVRNSCNKPAGLKLAPAGTDGKEEEEKKEEKKE